jgi:2-oxoglutarate ferredoxin oxidoreductase subunit alpha
MLDYSILIGGRAGDGIDKASLIIAHLLSSLGYKVFVSRDYPSLIRGGHTFSIIRISDEKIASYREKIDILIALNFETLEKHRFLLKEGCFYIYDSDNFKDNGSFCGTGVPLKTILKEENAPEFVKNSCLIGSFCKAAGIEWEILEKTLKKSITKEIEINLKVAKRGYDISREFFKIEKISQISLPVLTGNEALGLGFIKGGLDVYIGYPMTPSSALLHFLASVGPESSIKVIHPENEIAVILMALGFAYAGKKSAVGTSGGGFCLMNEGLSLAGMAEIPVVIVLGQRTGPSTGLPTYTGQTELFYAIHSGHGEFTRFVVSPGDCEQAYYLGAISVDIAWKYQIPSIILTDKSIAENVYSFNLDEVDQINFSQPIVWNGDEPFKRYKYTENGISPMCFVPKKEAIIKVNSYEHDEYGITTENPVITKSMQEKRVLIKEKFLLKEIENRFECVKVYGNKNSETAILCWGSNMPVCVELGKKYNLKVIQVVVLHPFPVNQFRKALEGVKRLIDIENNATGQLGNLIKSYGFSINDKILKYDGRPFSVDEIENKLKVL